MDFSNRGNRPQQQQAAPAQAEASTGGNQPQAPKKQKKGMGIDFGKVSSMIIVFGVAIIAAALVVGLVFGSDGNNESELIKQDKYQAVFLDSPDGQVYFGKLDVYNGDLYALTDIFYVRVEQPIQPEGQNQQAQPNISLAKLGNELHGPEDVMFISRDQVLYWENLKDDGQVVTAITEFKQNGEQPTQQAPAANQQGAAPAGGTQPAGTPAENDTPAEAPTTPAADTGTTN